MDLCHVPTLKALLERHGLQPTKRFGQHFLVSSRVVRAIVDAVPEGTQSVLEVGPGPGVLTRPLSERVQKVLAFEVDPIAVSALSESAPAAEVRHADVLTVDLARAISELPSPTAVVSNMPYNITGPLLTRFTEVRSRFTVAILMMQKEVGRKIVAPSGHPDFGSISILLQTRFDIQHLINAPAGAFFPPPKVDSIVLVFRPRDLGWSESFDRHHEATVRQAFRQPRKTLVNNLGPAIRPWLEAKGYSASLRPHQVPLEDWVPIAEAMNADSP